MRARRMELGVLTGLLTTGSACANPMQPAAELDFVEVDMKVTLDSVINNRPPAWKEGVELWIGAYVRENVFSLSDMVHDPDGDTLHFAIEDWLYGGSGGYMPSRIRSDSLAVYTQNVRVETLRRMTDTVMELGVFDGEYVVKKKVPTYFIRDYPEVAVIPYRWLEGDFEERPFVADSQYLMAVVSFDKWDGRFSVSSSDSSLWNNFDLHVTEDDWEVHCCADIRSDNGDLYALRDRFYPIDDGNEYMICADMRMGVRKFWWTPRKKYPGREWASFRVRMGWKHKHSDFKTGWYESLSRFVVEKLK